MWQAGRAWAEEETDTTPEREQTSLLIPPRESLTHLSWHEMVEEFLVKQGLTRARALKASSHVESGKKVCYSTGL